ncbi:MAG: DUF4169 family protein [bacterium]
MADIVNLRLARKQKEREAARLKGIEAAAKSGRTKALKTLEQARAEKAARDLDGKLREGQKGQE